MNGTKKWELVLALTGFDFIDQVDDRCIDCGTLIVGSTLRDNQRGAFEGEQE